MEISLTARMSLPTKQLAAQQRRTPKHCAQKCILLQNPARTGDSWSSSAKSLFA
jgi:hypothetical protein